MLVRTPNDLAAVVRQARLDAGLTQAELAARIGVSRLWVVKFEQGKAEAEVGLALRALRVLGLSIHIVTADQPRATAAPAETDRSNTAVDLNDLLTGGRA